MSHTPNVFEYPEFPDGLAEDPSLTYDPGTSEISEEVEGLESGEESGLEASTAWVRSAPEPREGESGGGASEAPFELKRLVGRGGLGEVWEARQASLGRTVAVKTIRQDLRAALRGKPGCFVQMLREFKQEAIASASLEHPNIVPVYDLGASGGEGAFPMLAMKLTRGEPWDKALRRDFDALPAADFLARHLPVLIDMAQAVAFAHSRGIVHRDLKPSQVVTGEFGEAFLIDWGLAIRVAEEAGAKPGARPEPADAPGSESLALLPTPESASNPAGTPALMAPEQTLPSAEGVGPWTDAYLLGGTLFWLLTGGYPHAAPNSREAMRLASLGEVEAPSARAPGRDIPPELEALCAEALAKEPDARPSAKAFVQRLRDYLSGASRRRESLALARQADESLQKALGEGGGAPAAGEAYLLHADAADLAERALRLWPENPEALALRERNLQARLATEIDNGDLLLARVHLDELRRARASRGLDDPADLALRLESAAARRERVRRQRIAFGVAAALLFAGAVALALVAAYQAREARESARQARLSEEEARRQQAVAFQGLKGVFSLTDSLLGEFRASLDLSREEDRQVAEAAGRGVFDYYMGADASGFSDQMLAERARQMAALGRRFGELGLFQQGEALATPSLALRRRLLGPESPEAAEALAVLSDLREGQGDYAQAEKLAREVLAIREKALGPDHLDTAETLGRLGSLRRIQDDPAQAEKLQRRSLAILEKALGPGHPETGVAWNNLGNLRRAQGDAAGAEKLFLKALDVWKAADSNPLDQARALSNLGVILRSQGEQAEAEERFREALAIMEKTLGPEHPDLAGALSNLGNARIAQGDYPGAEKLYSRAVAIWEKAPGSNHVHYANVLTNLGSLRKTLGEPEQAEELYERALAVRKRALEAGHPLIASSLVNLAFLHQEQGHFDQAEGFFLRALAIWEATLGPAHPQVADGLGALGLLSLERGDHAKAEGFFRRAQDIWRAQAESEPQNPRWDFELAGALQGLSEAVLGQGPERLPEARPLAEEALSLARGLAEALPGDPEAAGRLAWALFGRACLEAAAGDADAGFSFLEESAALDGGDPEALESDPRLEPLRLAGPERFAALLAMARSNAEAQAQAPE